MEEGERKIEEDEDRQSSEKVGNRESWEDVVQEEEEEEEEVRSSNEIPV